MAADAPAPIRVATLWAALGTAVLSSLLLGEGLALNLLIVAVPAALAVFFAGQAAGRRPRPLTWLWAAVGLGLLVVPALRDAGWPSFLAVVAAFGMGSLAVHGSRTWLGALLNPLGVIGASGSGVAWAWRGLRDRVGSGHGRAGPVLRAVVVSAVLLMVFGALFASADQAFSSLLSGLIPDTSVSDGPWRVLLFALGALLALAAAHSAAAPLSWDRLTVAPGRPRGRLEWALPLVVLNLLFGVFNVIQLAVLFGGYDAALRQGLTYADYARQGFWQLLFATLLTLLVIALASRWAPRGDRTLVRGILGTLCGMTLIVVASALRRLDMYVDAYGLTRLRISVMAAEIWFGVVIVLIVAAGIWGARWLPRAVVVSAAAGVLVFGLVSPDGLIAERNVQRYEDTGHFDLEYAQGLSADAVSAFKSLPEPLRSCAVSGIVDGLGAERKPWYATSLGEARARRVDAKLPAGGDRQACADASPDGPTGSDRDSY
ncbi:DUF4173 domain-containing protein [Streptomyces sp. YIM 130001]|uniref:DUF4153 domain-containing protein n=1 Tax=Streptomyces sp. YIM 130001 TaxID=2259644 RepID=UPI001F0997D2|nr:DUF4173 domain-containing protein [Streptomyces sp. YIM 130001]